MEVDVKSIQFLCLLFGLLFCAVSHAQTACPPGMEEYGAGVCGYSQSEQPAQQVPPQQAPREPPPKWLNLWGAIATDGPGGHLGTAVNMSSRDVAEQSALADCRTKGGSNCKLENTYGNACAAMIVGDTGHNSNSAATLDDAIKLGIKTCSKAGDTNCHVYYSACSLAVRTQ